MVMRDDLSPDARVLASEVFNRSWQFLERDPVLAGEDREAMQEQLAELILSLVSSSEQNSIVVANRAIATLRQRYEMRRDRVSVVEAA